MLPAHRTLEGHTGHVSPLLLRGSHTRSSSVSSKQDVKSAVHVGRLVTVLFVLSVSGFTLTLNEAFAVFLILTQRLTSVPSGHFSPLRLCGGCPAADSKLRGGSQQAGGGVHLGHPVSRSKALASDPGGPLAFQPQADLWLVESRLCCPLEQRCRETPPEHQSLVPMGGLQSLETTASHLPVRGWPCRFLLT